MDDEPPVHEEDLSDIEDKILEHLHQIRELKEKRKEEKTDLVDSEDEEDPRLLNDSSQQPSYFQKSRQATAERMIKAKLLSKQNDEKSSQGAGSTFASRMQNFSQKVNEETEKRRKLEEKLKANRVYSFDLDFDFKPLDLRVDEKEHFSGKQISRRYVKNETLEKLFKHMKCMRVEHALAKISPPNFEPPQYSNYVIIGVVVSKSETKTASDNKSKFINVQISNFKQQITLTLLSKAFERYWKLRLGDIVAVLNPQIYVFKEKKGFSLTLKDNSDNLLEIGHSKDFGLCKAMKKDGVVCNTPIDTSKNQFCDFHIEKRFGKTASKRLELSGSSRMFSPTENGVKQAFYMGVKKDQKGEILEGHLATDQADYVDRRENIGRLYFSNPGASKAFFNDSYQNPNTLQELKSAKSKMELTKNEKALRRKLGSIAGGSVLKKTMMDTKETKKETETINSVAFGAKITNNIGFNPTHGLFEKKKQNTLRTSANKMQLISSLRKEAQKKEKYLGPSRDDLISKKRKWDTNTERLNKFRKKSDPEPAREVGLVELSDSDSD